MNNDSLHTKHCIPCEGNVEKMSADVAHVYIERVNEWVLDGDRSISKLLITKDFKEALQLVNKIADIAESENHHPDICINNWNRVNITLSTHAIHGLSENDFILASKIDEYIRNKQIKNP